MSCSSVCVRFRQGEPDSCISFKAKRQSSTTRNKEIRKAIHFASIEERSKKMFQVINANQFGKLNLNEIIRKRSHNKLSLIHICRCRRYAVCRSRWSPYH
eukprot:TRINITY_DN14979_c0_g2_i1.p4 TRINITY_DN14979_c0_g2~~TRINITY_DN14979_c0_g2_i1.p4  ORF type:complete len:100 (-),score=10.78 TRINITY_DN14979_c0_g2_i1:17-316(-)